MSSVSEMDLGNACHVSILLLCSPLFFECWLVCLIWSFHAIMPMHLTLYRSAPSWYTAYSLPMMLSYPHIHSSLPWFLRNYRVERVDALMKASLAWILYLWRSWWNSYFDKRKRSRIICQNKYLVKKPWNLLNLPTWRCLFAVISINWAF